MRCCHLLSQRCSCCSLLLLLFFAALSVLAGARGPAVRPIDTSGHTFAMRHCASPGVTLNKSLYERLLRDLLVERAEHTVELYEGSGASWNLAR